LNVEVAHGATFFAGRGVALDSTSSSQSRQAFLYCQAPLLTEQIIATARRCIGRFACR
jgi:hypothetical protein